MARTKFRAEGHKDIFLCSTKVENLFINEFLPDAPGDCVKVFVFGLMYAQYAQEIESRQLALTLGLTEKELDNAWKYWESKGLVNLTGSGEELEVEFLSQIDLFYGKTPAAAAESEDQPEADESAEAIIERLTDQQLHEIFVKYQDLTGRTVSRGETGKLTDAVKLYNIEPDVLDFAIDYCIGIDKYSVDYICKVALRWTEEGARDVATVKKMLDQRSKRNDAYRKIFAALGFNRLPNPADREIMDKWFDDMGCTLAEALDACKAAGGMREPHLKYVSKVIENRMLEKGGINTRAVRTDSRGNTTAASASEDSAKVSRKVLKDYYEHIRRSDEASHRAKIAEVTGKLPEMKDLFAEETRLNSAVISMKPGPEARENRQRLRDKRKELEESKKELLRQNGYPEDYLDRKFRCGICRDTGYTDEGRVCTCAKERAEEAYKWIQKRNQ